MAETVLTPTDVTTFDFEVKGMTCGSCAARVQRTLTKLAGVAQADVNFATARARVDVDARRTSLEDLQSAVSRTGYELVPAGGRTVDFDVQRMTCGSCATRVQRVLARQKGVREVEVNFATGRARVTLEPAGADLDVLGEAVSRIGYGLTQVGEGRTKDHDAAADEDAARRRWLWRVVLAWPLALVVLGLSPMFPIGIAHEPWARWLSLALTVPVQFYVGWPFLAGAAKRARSLTANMDTLIAIGTLSAFSLSLVELFLGESCTSRSPPCSSPSWCSAAISRRGPKDGPARPSEHCSSSGPSRCLFAMIASSPCPVLSRPGPPTQVYYSPSVSSYDVLEAEEERWGRWPWSSCGQVSWNRGSWTSSGTGEVG